MTETTQTTNEGPLWPGEPGRLGRKVRRVRARALLIIILGDLLALVLAAIAAMTLSSIETGTDMLLHLLPMVLIAYVVIAMWGNAYSLTTLASRRRMVGRGMRTVAGTVLLVTLTLFTLKVSYDYSRILLTIFFLALICGIASARYVLWPYVSRTYWTNAFAEVLINDGGTAPPNSGALVISAADYDLVPDTTQIACVERLAALAAEVDRIVVYCPPERRAAWADTLKCLGTRGEVRIDEFDAMHPLGLENANGKVTMLFGQPPLEWHQAITKRIFDLCVLFALLPVLAPLFLVVAIAIKCDSRGPVFFRQRRLGLGNEAFMMFKFRSMRTDMQDNEARLLTQRQDPRITRVGRFIRATSIDELPQFINVLIGNMSIVGPRPHAPMALAGTRLYWEVDQRYWHRHVAKPGITGLAQVRGFRGNTFAESDLQLRLNADLEYLNDWSLIRDVEILFATLRVIRHEHAF